MALVAMDRRDLRSIVRFAAPIVIIGFASELQLVLDTISGSSLSDHERTQFIELVRQPHHALYRAFPTFEYVRTGLWFAGLAISLGVLWRLRAARLLAVLTGTILLLCAIGAVASEAEAPFLLVNAQTSRLSALIVLVGVAAVAGALCRGISPAGAAVALVGAFLLGPAFGDWLGDRFPAWGTIDAAEATMLLAVLVASGALIARGRPAVDGPERSAWFGPVAAGAVAIGFAAASVSMLVEHADRVDAHRDQWEIALKDVAAKAEERTEPGDLVLGSPTDDGLRVYARRPTVVEYGFIRLGSGDDEWRQRMFDVTGNPHVLDPDAAGTSIGARKALIDGGYRHTIEQSTFPICKYDAKVVIAKPLARPPSWLTPVYGNDLFALYEVVPGTCPGENA
jgi:hypothetical protein